MTSKEYDKLTDQEKQIKVAELAGWTGIYDDKPLFAADTDRCPLISRLIGYMPDTKIAVMVPDYLNDLNSMHEAEMSMNTEKHRAFVLNLINVLEVDLPEDDYDCHEYFSFCHATAAQRSKAYVLTMTQETEEE